MTKKEILRKVLLISSCSLLFYIAVSFLLGKEIIIYICIFCFTFALYLILIVVLQIHYMITYYKLYKICKDLLEVLKALHRERHKLYFTGTKEQVEEYSTLIEESEELGTCLMNICEYFISNNLLSKKHAKKIEEILNQTKMLMKNGH